ncbi:peptidylprolyl isomerase [Pseudoalteromonas aurantia]|uniref:peptidylprolyl isomerase n=1 Tax=Pseudoalteromonas aurantia 208 TaxID=1314867 RepID=A0ABR9EA53_9GAMM|nr:peptidylprolyl isomerase [Pseudoalteromonas aurantia]MBE0367249.1 peptidylprolyl isomerase [Pseudoalteromonas aurantia 208]
MLSIKKDCIAFITLAMSMIATMSNASTIVQRAPHEIVENAPSDAWRTVESENIIKFELATGAVYIELNTQLAPMHVLNMKKLVREQFYDGLNIYRFVEGFVAQGGDQKGTKRLKFAEKSLPAEFYLTSQARLPITSLRMIDGYAPVTGFLNGFAVAQSADGKHTWQTHCTGVFAMARDNDVDSGGTEFYITLAPTRYLDRNISVFGRVLDGMEHVYRLMRNPAVGQAFNLITKARVLSDIHSEDTSKFRVFNTEHIEFNALIEARKSRPETWFIERPNYADVCSISVPIEKITGG